METWQALTLGSLVGGDVTVLAFLWVQRRLLRWLLSQEHAAGFREGFPIGFRSGERSGYEKAKAETVRDLEAVQEGLVVVAAASLGAALREVGT